MTLPLSQCLMTTDFCFFSSELAAHFSKNFLWYASPSRNSTRPHPLTQFSTQPSAFSAEESTQVQICPLGEQLFIWCLKKFVIILPRAGYDTHCGATSLLIVNVTIDFQFPESWIKSQQRRQLALSILYDSPSFSRIVANHTAGKTSLLILWLRRIVANPDFACWFYC